MSKIEKKVKPTNRRSQSEEDEGETTASQIVGEEIFNAGVDDDDDTEANEDLSLKIAEKAMLRKFVNANSDAVAGDAAATDGVALEDDEVVMNFKDDESKKKEKNKKSNKKEAVLDSVDDVEKEEKVESDRAMEVVDEAVKTNPVEVSDNAVLRKLLRGPRYFNPPDSSWGACYNCGEEGHTTANCTSAKRKKPCFVCGSLEHNAKQCSKGRACFICKRGGHRAKDCPEKNRGGSQKICLKCGDSGHDMFTCFNKYCPDDLKEIQCYTCGSFGHLCCVNYTDVGQRDISCYRCGLSGHTGLACTGSEAETNSLALVTLCYRCGGEGHFARECTNSSKACRASEAETTGLASVTSCYRCGGEGHFARECTNSSKACRGSEAETTGLASVTSCYRCGGEGHFARECTNSSKSGKRNRELSTPNQRIYKENRDHFEVRSAPHDLNKARKKKKIKRDQGFMSASKSKQKHGWITEDPGDFLNSKAKATGWRSPATPNDKRSRMSNYYAAGHASTSYSSTKSYRFNYSNSPSNGSANFYQPRFSASRFGNDSSGGMRRDYDW